MNEQNRKTYSIRLYPEVMKAAKILAINEEMTLSAILEESIKDLIKKHSLELKTSKRKK